MNKNTVTDSNQKFFFDQNIFDEDGNIESELIEEEEPPPPMFSEAELAAAKKAAFQDGHTQATQEEKNSRAQHVAGVLETLSKDMAQLFAQEDQREAVYERESVELALRIFEQLFPHYTQEAGLLELKDAVEKIIKTHSNKSIVSVRVAPDLQGDIEDYLGKLQSQKPNLRFSVQGDDSLQDYACALSWDDGGGVHDAQTMAEEILGILKDGLAASDANRHDDKEEIRNSERLEQQASPEPQSDDASSDNPEIKETFDE